jgi:hypothetical protein
MASKRHPATRRLGGPGASHENRKGPRKSRPHGELPRADASSTNKQKLGNLRRGVGVPRAGAALSGNPSAARPGRRARPDLVVAGIKPKKRAVRRGSAARPKSARRRRPRAR